METYYLKAEDLWGDVTIGECVMAELGKAEAKVENLPARRIRFRGFRLTIRMTSLRRSRSL
jgi:hypothetical protein